MTPTQGQDGQPARAPSTPRRFPPPTAAQLAAVHDVMRLLEEDDLRDGVSAAPVLRCDGCRSTRPPAGAVTYGPYRLCNRCATAYELARLWRTARSIGDFLCRRSGQRVSCSA